MRFVAAVNYRLIMKARQMKIYVSCVTLRKKETLGRGNALYDDVFFLGFIQESFVEAFSGGFPFKPPYPPPPRESLCLVWKKETNCSINFPEQRRNQSWLRRSVGAHEAHSRFPCASMCVRVFGMFGARRTPLGGAKDSSR